MTTANLGFFTPGMSEITAPFQGTERIPCDVPNNDGINPASGAITWNQLASSVSGFVPFITGRFYGLTAGSTPVAILTVTATQYAYPIFVPNEVTVASLNIGVTTGQTGGVAHVGIYSDNGAGYPGTLVYDSGEITGLTSTTVVTKSSVAQVLPAGLYWISTIFNATSTFPTVTGATANYGNSANALLGSDTAAHALATSGQAVTGISVAAVYGALAETFPAGGALVINAATPVVVIGV